MVLGVRADFYSACTAYPQLRAALQAGPVLLDPMTDLELRQAIRLPAADVGLTVEDGLVEVLLADLRAAGGLAGAEVAGRLPLLAHALRATWQQRNGHSLTVDGYIVTGGIQHAVATTAERLFGALPSQYHEAARQVFLRLVIVGRDADDTRRRVAFEDLLRGAPDPEPAAAVVDDFVRGRLLTRDQDSVTITHEVLVRAWPRLRGWIEQDRAGNLLRQDLEAAAADWERGGREAAALYRGTRLETVSEWAAAHGPELSRTVEAFLAAARRHQSRGQRLRRSAVAAISALALLASSAAVFAFRQDANARSAALRALQARDQAVDSAVAANSLRLAPTDPSLSAQLALVAYRMAPTAQAASRVITAENTPLDTRLPGPKGSVYAVAYSPDGKTLAAGNVFGITVQLWDVSDPGHPVPLGEPLPEDSSVTSVHSVAFSPDGRTLAVGGATSDPDSDKGFVDLWDLTSPSHPVLLGRPVTPGIRDSLATISTIQSVAFSADGHTLAAGRSTRNHKPVGRVPPRERHPRRAAPGRRLSIRRPGFQPRRAHTRYCLPRRKRHRYLVEHHRPEPFDRRGQPLQVGGRTADTVAFSPDGDTLAVGSEDNDVHLWNTTNPDHPSPLGKPLSGPGSTVTSVAFSPDGHVLAAGSGDRAVHLWNVTDPADISPLGAPLTRPGEAVGGVAFSPDSRTLAAGNDDGDVDLWHLPPTQLAGAGGNVASVAFTPNGRTLAEANQNGTVSLWDTTDPEHPAPRGRPLTGTGTGPAQPVDSVAFALGGHLLAMGDSGGTITLWNTADPDHPTRLGQPLTGRKAFVMDLAFSPDGHMLAAAEEGDAVGGSVELWDLSELNDASEKSSTSIAEGALANFDSVAVSADEHTLAVGGDVSDGKVGLWTTDRSGIPVRVGEPIDQPAGTSAWVAFSPDDRTLAVANSHGTVTLWNTTDPNHATVRGHPLTVPDGSLESVAFSPDGHTLAAAGSTTVGTITLWNVTDPDNPTLTGQPLTVTTGPVSVLAFSPDNHTLAATTSDGVAAVWDLNVNDAIRYVCANSASALDAQQWNLYVSPQIAYAPPCG